MSDLREIKHALIRTSETALQNTEKHKYAFIVVDFFKNS